LSKLEDGSLKDEMKLLENNFASAYPPPVSPIKQKNRPGSNSAFRNSEDEGRED